MFKWLKAFVNNALKSGAFKTNDELYLYVILQIASMFALLVHVGLLALHLIGGFYTLALFNMGFFVLYCVCVIMLTQHRYYAFVGYALTLYVTAHATISILLTGTGTYKVFYFFVALVMQLIIPYTGIRGRVAMGALQWILVMLTSFVANLYTPVLDLGPIALAITVFNVQVGFLGIVLELMLGNYIKRVIEHYNEKRMAELAGQANHDPLTGLYNRRYASECFEEIAGAPEVPWCVAIMDIDNFKTLNDRYGHAQGDEVLRMVATTMKEKLRRTDLVFRWGGEEFLILLRDVNIRAAHKVMDELREEISDNRIQLDSERKRITVSIGVCRLNPTAIEASINACDQKMYEGKSRGKNIVVA